MSQQQRIAPHSIEAEQAVIGGLLLNVGALVQVADWLEPEDFYRRDHQVIYRAIIDLQSRDQPCDALTLGEWFEAQGISELVGGSRYVLELANSTPSAANVAAYGEIVRERSRLRQMIDVAGTLASEAFEPRANSAANIVAKAQAALAQIAVEARVGGLQQSKPAVREWLTHITQLYERDEDVTGVQTPWLELTALTCGFQPGELILFAGRPNMGKSIAVVQCAIEAAMRDERVALFSLEMTRRQVVQRAIASIGRVQHEFLRKPKDLADEEWPRLTSAAQIVAGAALLIDDQAQLTAQQIVMRAKREHLRAPLKMVVIDHLHEVKRPGDDPVNELGDVARAFKGLAKDLGIPVLLAAQLNRANTKRNNNRPTMADLRASGAIEEVADVALLIHREDYYDSETEMKGLIELIVGKGRDIKSGGVINLQNEFQYMRMSNWSGPLPTRSVVKKVRGRGMDAQGSDD